jgi:hypothetical protein
MPKKTKTTQPAPEEEDEVQIINFDSFDLEGRFALKAISLKDQKDRTQYLCFPKYAYEGEPEGEYDTIMDNGEAAIIVTDDVVINKGGIPRFNTKYHANPDSMGRAYFYIARDDTCPGSVELFKWIQGIDDYFDQKINKDNNADEVVCYTIKSKKTNKFIKKPFQDLTYKRMISMTRKPKSMPEDEEDDAPKKEYIPYERIKVKFSTIWDENLGPNDLKEIDTVLFVPGEDDPVDATRVSDFDKHFTWKSTCKFGLMLNKFWIDKSDERNCSFGLKCVQLAVTEARPDTQKKTATTQLSRSLFTGKKFNRSTTDDEEVDETVENEEVDEEVEGEDIDEEDVEEAEDEESEESEDEDEAEEEDAEEEEDEDEDEDVEESEDEDVEESEDEDVEEDEESEEEEPAPKRRAAKGKKAPAKKATAKKGAAKNVKVRGKGNSKAKAKGKRK